MNKDRGSGTVASWPYVLAVVALYGAWLYFSASAPGHHAQTFLRDLIPRWYAAMNLALVPVLIAVAASPWRIALALRVILTALFCACLVVAQVAVPLLRTPSWIMVLVLFVELYWFLPKWRARYRKRRGH